MSSNKGLVRFLLSNFLTVCAEELILTTKNGLKYSGILIPSEWGRDGEIIGISLESQNEREYVLHPESPVLSELKGLLRRRVRLEGHMVEAAGGEVLFVSGYSLT